MFGIKRMVIAQHERGLQWRNKRFAGALEPGVHWMFDPLRRGEVEIYDLTEPQFEHKRVDFMLKESREVCERCFQVVELSDREVGLVYRNNKLKAVLAPGTRQLYWRGPIGIRIEVQDLSTDFEVPRAVAHLVGRTRTGALSSVLGSSLAGVIQGAGPNAVYAIEVPDASVGLLIVDGEFKRVLQPGFYAYWKFNRTVKVDLVDLRLQSMEVSGQEILTRDKVSLRVNLAATYRITEVVKARQELADFSDFLYRELQFALREAIGTRTLDTLLGEKGDLDRAIAGTVREKVSAHGLEVRSVGIKDVILPGDMKEILNKVVEAEKLAQATLIKRREETAATRSLLNTAKLMEENPILLRLKELETLEKVTEKIDKLTVFGGLDGVLKDTVRINVQPA